jgi:hypothetical protein
MAKQKFNPAWSELDNINYLQRKIIKLSIAYYEMDYSFIDDSTFDELCYQLVDMQKSEVAKDSKYWYMMSDFDGSTGADLYYKLSRRDKNWLWWVVEKEIYLREHPVKLDKPVKKKKRKGRLF